MQLFFKFQQNRGHFQKFTKKALFKFDNTRTLWPVHYTITYITRQVYNLFQDLWKWFIISEGWQSVKSPFGVKAFGGKKTRIFDANVLAGRITGIMLRGMALTNVKWHESMSYETMLVIAGLLFKFTIVKMRKPNKSLNRKKHKALRGHS